MLHLTSGQTSNIVVTLQEKTTLASPYYIFLFTHLTTKEEVRFTKGPSDDLTNDVERYNEYEIDAADLLDGASVGQWSYSVFESTTDTTDETGKTEVERGKMRLSAATQFEYTQYEGDTNYKAYGGQ